MNTSGLARHLVEDGYLSDSDCQLIARDHSNTAAAIAKVVVALGIFSEDKLSRYMATRARCVLFPSDQVCTTTASAEGVLDLPLMQSLEVVPLELNGRVLSVAMADPFDKGTLSQLRFFTDYNIKPVVASFTSLHRGLARVIEGFHAEKTNLEKFFFEHSPKFVGRGKSPSDSTSNQERDAIDPFDHDRGSRGISNSLTGDVLEDAILPDTLQTIEEEQEPSDEFGDVGLDDVIEEIGEAQDLSAFDGLDKLFEGEQDSGSGSPDLLSADSDEPDFSTASQDSSEESTLDNDVAAYGLSEEDTLEDEDEDEADIDHLELEEGSDIAPGNSHSDELSGEIPRPSIVSPFELGQNTTEMIESGEQGRKIDGDEIIGKDGSDLNEPSLPEKDENLIQEAQLSTLEDEASFSSTIEQPSEVKSHGNTASDGDSSQTAQDDSKEQENLVSESEKLDSLSASDPIKSTRNLDSTADEGGAESEGNSNENMPSTKIEQRNAANLEEELSAEMNMSSSIALADELVDESKRSSHDQSVEDIESLSPEKTLSEDQALDKLASEISEIEDGYHAFSHDDAKISDADETEGLGELQGPSKEGKIKPSTEVSFSYLNLGIAKLNMASSKEDALSLASEAVGKLGWERGVLLRFENSTWSYLTHWWDHAEIDDDLKGLSVAPQNLPNPEENSDIWVDVDASLIGLEAMSKEGTKIKLHWGVFDSTTPGLTIVNCREDEPEIEGLSKLSARLVDTLGRRMLR